MNLLQEWKSHLQKTSDFWVDRGKECCEFYSDREKESMFRKKESLKERKAKIVKADVRGHILGVHRYDNKQLVRYRTHLSFLINQNGDLYIEEEIKEKYAHFKNNQLVSDQEIVSERNDQAQTFSVIESPSNKRSKMKGSFYDRLSAVKYADRWWNSGNPEYTAFDVDCTNYVSQCLYAGGLPMSGKYNQHTGWWYAGKSWSLSWAVAHSLRWYLSSDQNVLQATSVDRPEKLQPGDVICYDFEGDNRYDHSTFVTAKDAKGMPLVNAHTTNSRHRYWSYEDSSAWTGKIQYKFFHIND